MNCSRRRFVELACGATALTLTACRDHEEEHGEVEEPKVEQEPPVEEEPQVDLREFHRLAIDMDAWKYDAAGDVYYQLQVPYCLHPGAPSLESLAIFVPGAYLTTKEEALAASTSTSGSTSASEDQSSQASVSSSASTSSAHASTTSTDDEATEIATSASASASAADAKREAKRTYSCIVDPEAHVGPFTATTAPILMPINSGTLSAQVSPTSFGCEGLERYLKAGCIYVYAGFRGRSAGYESRETGKGGAFSGGAPWPVVDLKAVVRFLRYNAADLPGDMDRIFTFGFSAGGGLSSLLGASGDAEVFEPYLAEIGAATHDAEGTDLSDAIFGCASWCPITSYGAADAAYEWMMGQYADAKTRAEGTWTKLLSTDLSGAYAAYLNDLALTDEDGNPLTLEVTGGEVYAAGSYYDHLLSTLEDSVAAFLQNVTFPYTYTPQHLVNPIFPGDPNLQSIGAGTPDVEAVSADASAVASGALTAESGTADAAQQVTYATEEDYLSDLNHDTWWLTYNERRQGVYISSLGEFCRHLKVAAKDVCAFDALDRSTVENQLFGTDDAGSLHFSQTVCDLIVDRADTYAQDEGFDETLTGAWETDLAALDALEVDVTTRVAMFDPLYFLATTSKGFGTSTVAPYWRINSGVFQTDTSLTTELNLALAARSAQTTKDVAFTPVWGQGHVLAEVSGNAEDNLLTWVVSCCS